MSEKENYLKRQEACGLREHDVVRVTRSAQTGEDGWDNSWTEDMNRYVGGRAFRVTALHEYGIRIGNSYSFPYFVLEKNLSVPKFRVLKTISLATVASKSPCAREYRRFVQHYFLSLEYEWDEEILAPDLARVVEEPTWQRWLCEQGFIKD
jgi:hypothetical protein